MKARCARQLTVDNGFTFEAGKEYEFEESVEYLDAKYSKVILCRGNKTRHIAHSTVISLPQAGCFPFYGPYTIGIRIFFHERAVCEAYEWKAPSQETGSIVMEDEEMLCFDDYFEQVTT